LKDSNKTVET